MNTPKIVITRQQQQAQLTAAGQVQQIIRVDFMVGEDGPFNVSIPADQFHADMLHQAIMQVANQALALRAKLLGS